MRHPRVDDPMVTPPADLWEMANHTQFIISDDQVMRKWQELERLATGNGVDPGKVGAQMAFLDPLFLGCEEVSVVHPITAIFRGTGDSTFTHFEIFCEVDDEKRPFVEGLEVCASLNGFIEAVYIVLHLRSKFLPWHGIYGRDYAFLFNENSTWVHGIGTKETLSLIKSKVDRPLGIRISKRHDRFYVSCLTAYSNGELVDKTIRLKFGRVVELPSPDLISRARFCLFS